MRTSKSPRKVMHTAWTIAQKVLPAYAHRYSPRRFTQPQLFACLVLKSMLDQDYRGVPFEPLPQLMAVAEYVTKALAVCVRCGAPANRTQRTIASQERIVVGTAKIYEARCRRCFEPNLAEQMAIPLGPDDS